MISIRSITFRSLINYLLLVVVLSTANPVWAAKISGTFVSQQACPAYVSKKKLTNPDESQLTIAGEYTIIEANQKNNPSWYRIIVPNASPEERWIKAECGIIHQQGNGTGGGSAPNQCGVAGHADSYVLALSWQPAFCEIKSNKPECSVTDPNVYQARHFTLHGLWPNQRQCGIDYSFCGKVKEKQEEFCNYPTIDLDAVTRSSLAEIMPSVSAGSCLERHEWHKHGTCQANWSVQQYYALSADLTRQFNDSGMAYFMNRRIGKVVRTEDFMNRLSAVLGEAARSRIKLICKQDMLIEVQLMLTVSLNPNQDLETLIAAAPTQTETGCGASFRVDPIGPNQ
ncbi:MAG: ribonuclease T [Nitrosomonas sp.]|nr:ribonuclease T [Nitrosomonas sp.]MBK7365121.1 ribonuclease T [Nitrosomonas sp.]